MARQPNTDVNGRTFSETTIDQVWKTAGVIAGQDPNVIRNDACGWSIKRAEHGSTNSLYGWEIDHKRPVAKDGGDEPSNLQPLYWKTNREKSDTYPWSCR